MQANKKDIKILLLGNSFVGKTTLLESYIQNHFKSEYKATIGANFLTKSIEHKGAKINAQIWDTAGQERHQESLTKQYYRGSDACIFVFDVTDRDSFNSIEKWIDNYLMHIASQTNIHELPKILVGNKTDVKDKRVVTEAEARDCIRKNGINEYFETSAKEMKGVTDSFEYIIKKAADLAPSIPRKPADTVEIKKINKEKKCCTIF